MVNDVDSMKQDIDRTHGFYSKTLREQNLILTYIGLAALSVILISLWISWLIHFYLLGIASFAIVLSIIAPFFDTPGLKKSNRLNYQSLLFLSEPQKNGIIKIHGGTLFDYFFVLDRKMNGRERTNFILQEYLFGLLNLIEAQENQSDNAIIVRGTSYIINDRTAKRLGFEVINTDMLQRIILGYNYFQILLANSLAKGKLSFPRLGETKTFEAKLQDLAKRKSYIKMLMKKLKYD